MTLAEIKTELKLIADKHQDNLDLLNEIIATFSIEKNKETLREAKPENIELFILIVDKWVARFNAINSQRI